MAGSEALVVKIIATDIQAGIAAWDEPGRVLEALRTDLASDNAVDLAKICNALALAIAQRNAQLEKRAVEGDREGHRMELRYAAVEELDSLLGPGDGSIVDKVRALVAERDGLKQRAA